MKLTEKMRNSSLDPLLKELVAIPSVNPSFGGDGEAPLCGFIEEWFRERGIETRRQAVMEGRENLLAFCGSADRPTLVLDAHMDTVGTEGWETGSPFDLQEREGRFFGRGACDTKASLAVFMTVAEQVARDPDAFAYSILFAATVDEEAEQLGAFEVARSLNEYKLAGAIAGEPTLSSIVNQHKGVCRYRFRLRGAAAHAATPELGQNAIYRAAALVARIEALGRRIDKGPAEELLARSTLNLGRIRGGIGYNVVPDSCELDVDRRLAIRERPEEARAQLAALIEDFEDAELETKLERPSVFTPPDDGFVVSLLRAARALDPGLGLKKAPYMTNAVAYRLAGVPALVFGPGDIAQAHMRDEHISKGEMERSQEILLRFVREKP